MNVINILAGALEIIQKSIFCIFISLYEPNRNCYVLQLFKISCLLYAKNSDTIEACS